MPRMAPPFSEAEVQRVLRSSERAFTQCLEMAGVPEVLTLRVAVEADGRLVLTNANLPTGSSRHAIPCLNRSVSRLRVSGRPARRRTVTHRVALRG